MIAGPFAAVATLLVVAGAMKVRGRSRTRLLGVAEVVVGLGALARGDGAGAAAVAVTYAGFAVFVVWRWWRSGGTASCECFGATPTRASVGHAVVDAMCASVAVAAALSPPGSLAHVLGRQPAAGVPFVLLTATVAYLAFTMMTTSVATP